MVLIQCEFVALYFAVECWDRVEILSKELLNDMKIFAFCILLIWSKLFESLLTHFSEIILKQRAILGMAKMAHTYGPMASSNGGHSQGWSGYIGCPCLNFMLILKNLHVNYQYNIQEFIWMINKRLNPIYFTSQFEQVLKSPLRHQINN